MTAAAILAVLWPLGRKARCAGRRQRSSGLSGSIGGNRPRSQRRPDRPGRSRRRARRGLAPAVGRGRCADGGGQPARARRSRCGVAARQRLRRWSCCRFCRSGFISRSARRMFRASQPSPASSTPQTTSRSTAFVGQVEAHLAKNPNDGAGWEVIAPVYLRLGRFDDAVVARRKSLALNGETGDARCRSRRGFGRRRQRRRDRRGQASF